MKRKSLKVRKAQKQAEVTPLLADTTGGPTMEWTLLLGFMALPAYWVIKMLLATLTAYYGMMTTINAMPLP
ncbi:MAG: hypothetical protein ACF8OB_02135 [Phycisphaeraceae bacterium JB051]